MKPQNIPHYSPQLIHHTDQHKESVLADSLLEGVRTVAKASICALWSRTMRTKYNNTLHFEMTVHALYKLQPITLVYGVYTNINGVYSEMNRNIL